MHKVKNGLLALGLLAVLGLNACGGSDSDDVGSDSAAGVSSVEARPSEIQPRQQPNAGDASQVESTLAQFMNTAEARLRACANNDCLHAELRTLSKNMKTVNSTYLSTEQHKRLSQRSMSIQRLAAKLAK